MRQHIQKALQALLVPAIMPRAVTRHHRRNVSLNRPCGNVLRRIGRGSGQIIRRLSTPRHQRGNLMPSCGSE
jgi:hypothetical protein